MRLVAFALILALSACVVPRPSAINNLTVLPQDVPAPGTDATRLNAWFAEEGYVPGPRVLQSKAELVRRPGDPIVYASQLERVWWLSQQQSVHDLCVTSKIVYYRLTPDGTLIDAVPTVRSHC